MDTNRNKVGSHLFLVRLWLEGEMEVGAGTDGADKASSAWRGTVQHILTGKSANFYDRLALTELILEMMPARDDSKATQRENGATQ